MNQHPSIALVRALPVVRSSVTARMPDPAAHELQRSRVVASLLRSNRNDRPRHRRWA